MSPEEKLLLERATRLSEENNLILKKMQRTAKIAVLWGLIKVILIVTPLVLGYVYLQPFFSTIIDNINSVQELLKI